MSIGSQMEPDKKKTFPNSNFGLIYNFEIMQ